MSELPYREGVVAVFCDKENNVLIGKRFGTTDSWQFPQGGIEELDDESPYKAVFREVHEEFGCDRFDILKTLPTWIAYDFPLQMKGKVAERYKGQKQIWFLCRFHPGYGPDLDQASDKEFDAVKWAKVEQVLHIIVEFKKPAYLVALTELGLLTHSQTFT